jgi:Methylase involved in ubiquinone/menaquinone biosynthesis
MLFSNGISIRFRPSEWRKERKYTMDVAKANKKAWDNEAKTGNYWTIPVDRATIEKARNGVLAIHLTPEKFVRASWYENIKGDVLALASGGGQQAPQFAASGCRVTVLDNSEKQLKSDQMVAKREGLSLITIRGDMRDLSAFEDESFDVVFNPVSVNFIPSLDKMQKEVHRVLRKGGCFFTAFANPVLYCFDEKKEVEKKKLKVKYTLPYSDLKSISRKELEKRLDKKDTIEFSHTLQTLIGNLVDTGFDITGFETDHAIAEPVDSYIQDCYIAIMCRKR